MDILNVNKLAVGGKSTQIIAQLSVYKYSSEPFRINYRVEYKVTVSDWTVHSPDDAHTFSTFVQHKKQFELKVL